MKASYDSNHFEIKEAIYDFGGEVVLDLAAYRAPVDFLAAFRKDPYIIEAKNPETVKYKKSRWQMLTSNEKDMATRCYLLGIPYYVVQNAEEVRRVLFDKDPDLIAVPEKINWK